MTLKGLYDKGKMILLEDNIPEAELNAWYLLEHIFKINRAQYYIRQSEPIDNDLAEEYLCLIDQRKSHMPYQYITGIQEFMGLSFHVNPSVLIPRLDTEILVEEVIKKLKCGMQVLDMCTGSGCIIISLTMQEIDITAVASDISEEALLVAGKNAERYHRDIKLIQSDLFDKIEGTYDVIVSNPPYISQEEMKGLMKEVKDYEPHLALYGREDGLYFYKKIIKDSTAYLNKGGYLFFEIGWSQAEAVKNEMLLAEFEDVTIIKDLAGLDRVIFGHR